MARPTTSKKIATEVEDTPITPRRRVRLKDEMMPTDSPIKTDTEREAEESTETVVEFVEVPEQSPATGDRELTYEPYSDVPAPSEPQRGRIISIEVSKTRQFEDFEPDRCTVVYELGIGEEEIIDEVYAELRQTVYDLLDMPLEEDGKGH